MKVWRVEDEGCGRGGGFLRDGSTRCVPTAIENLGSEMSFRFRLGHSAQGHTLDSH